MCDSIEDSLTPMSRLIRIGCRIDAIRDREFVDVLAKEVADERSRPPASRGDDLGKRRARSKEIGGEAPTEPVPSELSDVQEHADVADDREDTGGRRPKVDLAEDGRCGWEVTSHRIVDLGLEAADSAQKRSLTATDAPAPDGRTRLRILPSPEVDGSSVRLKGDI